MVQATPLSKISIEAVTSLEQDLKTGEQGTQQFAIASFVETVKGDWRAIDFAKPMILAACTEWLTNEDFDFIASTYARKYAGVELKGDMYPDWDALFDRLELASGNWAVEQDATQKLIHAASRIPSKTIQESVLKRIKTATGTGMIALRADLKEATNAADDSAAILELGVLASHKFMYDAKMSFENHPILHYWTGTHWSPNGVAVAQREYKDKADILLARQPKKAEFANLIHNILYHSSICQPEGVAWNKQMRYIAFQNGYLDTYILPWELYPPEPAVYATRVIKADYIPDATCPRFIRFFAKTVPEESWETVQRYAGYTLLNGTYLKRCLTLVGDTNTGKSTLIDIIRYAIGEELSVEQDPTKFTAENATGDMEGKLIGFYHDLPQNTLRRIDKIKIYIDQRTLKFVDKWIRQHEGPNSIHFWFAGNVLPRIPKEEAQESIAALLDRFMIVRCTHVWAKNKNNRDYAREIAAAEREGILAWCIRGLFKLLMDGGTFCHEQRFSLLDWLATSVPVAAFFRDNYEYSLDPHDTIRVDDFFAECNAWLTANDKPAYGEKAVFGRDVALLSLTRAQIFLTKKDRPYIYRGLIFKNP